MIGCYGMKKILLTFLLLFCLSKLSAQRFSQYNTRTLFDSFENPSQRAFIPDSSRQFASNFFIPNYGGHGSVTGNAQIALKSRAFIGNYNSEALQIGQKKLNHASINANVYSLMFRMYTSLDYNGELGVSIQTKTEGRAKFTDESVAIFDGFRPFPKDQLSYIDFLNDEGFTQTYNQIGFTYRENINKQLAVGIKLSSLLGIAYKDIEIQNSTLEFDPASNTVDMYLKGASYSTFDSLSTHDLLPTFRNPGAAISLGASYLFSDGSKLQGNIKDVGFIHWNKRSVKYKLDATRTIDISPKLGMEDSTYKAFNSMLVRSSTQSFNTMIDGKVQLMYSRAYTLYPPDLKIEPTLIVSKDLFYGGFTGALVNHIQYKNIWLSLTTAYSDPKIFDFGGQFMVKSPNMEFYIGSERLSKSRNLAYAIDGRSGAINKKSAYTGADFFIGFSLKFGNKIEHPMNANLIPNGEPGFFHRLYNRFFKTTR